MPNWLATCLRFVVEVFQAMWPFRTWPSAVWKIIVLSAPTVGGWFADKTNAKTGVVIVTDWGELHFAAVLAVLTAFAVLCWAVGATWVRFRSIRVENRIAQVGDAFVMSVTNHGYTEAKVILRVVEIADKNGPILALNDMLPKRLSWLDSVESECPLTAGLTEKATLIHLHGDKPGWNGLTDFCVGWFTIQLDLTAEPKAKYWFRITVGVADKTMWFSVESSGSKPDGVIVSRENPPHIKPSWLWRAMLFVRDSFTSGFGCSRT